MLKFFKKYRLVFKVLAVFAFLTASYFDFNDYFSAKNFGVKERKMKLFGGIVFGLMAVFQAGDLMIMMQEKKAK